MRIVGAVQVGVPPVLASGSGTGLGAAPCAPPLLGGVMIGAGSFAFEFVFALGFGVAPFALGFSAGAVGRFITDDSVDARGGAGAGTGAGVGLATGGGTLVE